MNRPFFRGIPKTYSLRGLRGVSPIICPAGLPAVSKTEFLEPPFIKSFYGIKV